MGRQRRGCFPNTMYHITNRGVRKEPIFYDELDRFRYLQYLEETKVKYPFQIHSYCLMTNHIHLLLQTFTDPISKIMLKLNTNYAKYFNKRYQFVGPVFQGRYGSQLVRSIQYELDVCKYIHLNPVKAQIVNHPEDYRWSSYRAYFYNEYNPHVETSRLLSYFPEPRVTLFKKFHETRCQAPKL